MQLKQFSVVFIVLASLFLMVSPLKRKAQMIAELQTSAEGVSQVFWDSNNKGFSEKNSYKIRISPLKTKYVFDIPKLQNIHNLRFDPINKSTKVKIKKIIFEQKNRNAFNFQSPRELSKLITPIHHIHSIRLEDDGLSMVFEGDDPQLALDVRQFKLLDKTKESILGYIIGWTAVLLLSCFITALLKMAPQKSKSLIASFFKTYVFRMNNIEFLTSTLISIGVVYYLSLWIWTMATTSLWTDEIYTIDKFSSKGVGTVLTDYHAPNNHIFFNLLNAITPYSDSYHPLRARLWSFLAMISAMGYTLFYYFKRKNYIAGALTLCLLGASWNHLNFMLQARGYALLAFCALSTSLVLLSYLQSHQISHLISLVLLSIMGTWTVPTYIFFAGPLLLILFLTEKNQESFIALSLFGIVIMMVYLPIMKQIIEVSKNYAGHWGEEYAKINAVFGTIEYHLFPKLNQWQLFLIFCGFLCLPFMLWEKGHFEGKAYRIIVLSTILFFVLCLYLKTPAQRTTAFIVFPFGIVLIGIVIKIYHYKKLKYLRPVLCILLLIFFQPIIEDKIASLKKWFAPTENWMGSTELISSVFPQNKSIYCNFRTNLLKKYLKGDYYFYDDDKEEFSLKKFKSSEVLFVDSHPWKKKRFDSNAFASDVIEILVPQTRGDGRYQKIAYAPPKNSNIRKVYLSKTISDNGKIFKKNGEVNWSFKTFKDSNLNKIMIKIEPLGTSPFYSLNIHAHNMTAKNIATVRIKKNGHTVKLKKKQIKSFYFDGRNWKRDNSNFDSLVTINLNKLNIDEIVMAINARTLAWDSGIKRIWLEKSD